MSPLRARMIEDMTLAGLAAGTQRSTSSRCSGWLRIIGARRINPLLNLEPSWNVAPTQLAPVVRGIPRTSERHLDLLQWGVVPYFTKDPIRARRPIKCSRGDGHRSGMFRRTHSSCAGTLCRPARSIEGDRRGQAALSDRPARWGTDGLRGTLGRLPLATRRRDAQLHPSSPPTPARTLPSCMTACR